MRSSVQSSVSVAVPDESYDSRPIFVKKSVPLVDTDKFAAVMAVIVMVNVFTIGFETDAPKDGSLPTVFGIINNLFLLAYIVELMLRLLTHGILAFKDPFTVMDSILVLFSFLERVLDSSGFARALPSFRMLRLIRLFRATRLLKYNKELAVLSAAGVRVMKSLFWVLVFLFMIVWSVACFANIAIGESAEWNESMDPNKTLEPFRAFDVREYFGSMVRSFLTFMQVVTVSQWAPHVARPVVQVYPTTVLFFVCFIMVVTYGLVVTIISNLVQDSMAASASNQKALQEVAREERRNVGQYARDILAEVDTDGSGDLTVTEIDVALKETNLADILMELGVPVSDPESLVKLLDFDGGGTVSFDELVEGVIKMDEEITSRDYQFMAFWLWNLLRRAEVLEGRLNDLVDQISIIRERLQGSFGALNHLIRTQGASTLRRRALHIIRTSGPALPPSLTRRKVDTGPKIHYQDPATEFMAFARRFLAEASPSPAQSAGDGWLSPPSQRRRRAENENETEEEQDDSRNEALRVTAHVRGSLPDAPARLEVAKKQAKEEDATLDENKYEMTRGFTRGFEQNPNLAVWRGLL